MLIKITIKYPFHWSELPLSTKIYKEYVLDSEWKKGNPPHWGATTMENSIEVFKNLSIELRCDQTMPILGLDLMNIKI